MKKAPLLKIAGIALGTLGGLMVVTNPGPSAYENYATQELNSYLKEQVCSEMPEKLQKLLQTRCHDLVDMTNPQMLEMINQTTQRHNFLFFSIYETNLEFGSPLPQYSFQTLGIFSKFYTYEAEKR